MRIMIVWSILMVLRPISCPGGKEGDVQLPISDIELPLIELEDEHWKHEPLFIDHEPLFIDHKPLLIDHEIPMFKPELLHSPPDFSEGMLHLDEKKVPRSVEQQIKDFESLLKDHNRPFADLDKTDEEVLAQLRPLSEKKFDFSLPGTDLANFVHAVYVADLPAVFHVQPLDGQALAASFESLVTEELKKNKDQMNSQVVLAELKRLSFRFVMSHTAKEDRDAFREQLKKVILRIDLSIAAASRGQGADGLSLTRQQCEVASLSVREIRKKFLADFDAIEKTMFEILVFRMLNRNNILNPIELIVLRVQRDNKYLTPANIKRAVDRATLLVKAYLDLLTQEPKPGFETRIDVDIEVLFVDRLRKMAVTAQAESQKLAENSQESSSAVFLRGLIGTIDAQLQRLKDSKHRRII